MTVPERTFADKLDHLLRQRDVTTAELAWRLNDGGGTAPVDRVAGLRAGYEQPTQEVITGVAAALDVPGAYFLDPRVTTVVDAVLALTRVLGDRGVRAIGPCRASACSAIDQLLAYACLLNVTSRSEVGA